MSKGDFAIVIKNLLIWEDEFTQTHEGVKTGK